MFSPSNEQSYSVPVKVQLSSGEPQNLSLRISPSNRQFLIESQRNLSLVLLFFMPVKVQFSMVLK